MTGGAIDVVARLLDRQLVDSNGEAAGKVDDLELDVPDDGGPPVLTAILTGPTALGHRIGGRLGAWIAGAGVRLRPPDQAEPTRIPFELVRDVGRQVDLSLPRADLDTERLEVWLSEHVVGRIPGSRR